jgi:hypothetical protein
MRLRNLVWSVTLGVAVTIGLLLGLSMISSLVVAASVDPAGEAAVQVGMDAAIRAQDTVSTAYVVVRFADNDVIVRAITFTTPISSYRALELAGLNPVGANTAWGLMLCGINGVGKALPDGSGCDNGTRYWSTLYWSNSAWVGYLVGAGDTVISQDGHIDGFSWSDPGWVAIDPPPAPPLTSASNALDWLRMQQQADGSFGSPGSTAEALIAVGANRIDATTWRHSPSLLANVLANGVALANGGFDAAAGAGKLAIALAANEGCWPIDAMQPVDHYSSTTGKFGVNPGAHAWAMMGTVALSQAVPASATQYLKSAQLSNGGWEWGEGWGDDTNSTALAIQALVAAGEPVTSTAIVSGLNYLDSAQNDDGGFPYSPTSMYGTDSDTNSTAYVVQALLAAESLTDTRWITYAGGITPTSPITFLLTMQLPDGSFEWQRGFGANRLATQQAIPALLHRPFPVKVAELDACYGISGRVMEGSVTGGGVTSYSNSDPMPDVTMWAQGANDLYFGTTISPTGYYTISVPIVGSYVLTPSKSGYVFSPTIRTVMVSGSPGDITGVEDFAGKAVLYLPLVIRS